MPRPELWTQLNPHWLRTLYHDLNLSLRDIAALAGVSHPTVQKAMRRHHIPLRPHPRSQQRITAGVLWRHYWVEGLTIDAVAERIGRSRSAVHRALHYHNIPTRPRGIPANGPPPATLHLYRFRGHTVYLRLVFGHNGPPPCPVLHDQIVEIPVIQPGQPPPDPCCERSEAIPSLRTTYHIADWLDDLLVED